MIRTVTKRSGFSLMELLAVVTILGIIAAIIVPRVTVSSDSAKQKVNAHNKATINAAVERWYVDFDKCIPYFAEAYRQIPTMAPRTHSMPRRIA